MSSVLRDELAKRASSPVDPPGGKSIRVLGVDEVLAQLHGEIRKIKFRSKKGLIKAGLIIQREAQQLCPVDTGNLKAGAFTIWGNVPPKKIPSPKFKGSDASDASMNHQEVISAELGGLRESGLFGRDTTVLVGFSAAYAIYVHENTAASHTSGESKFLQRAVNHNHATILKAVGDEAGKGL